MATVQVYSAARMQQIEDNTITGAEIIDGELWLQRYDGSLINAGPVAGGGGGDVATDTIWDAADDLAVGTGPNTAARLAVPASRVIAKLAAGGLKACTAAEICTLLSVYTSAQTDSAIATQIAAVIDSSPGTLDTLNELAAALSDDPNFATTMTTLIGTKETPAGAQAKADAVSAAILDGATFTGEIVVPDLSVAGLTGSVLPSRYCGRTAGGKPATGTHEIGDWVIGHSDASIWLCTGAGVAGTSTWVRMGGDRIVAEVESEAAQSGVTTVVDLTGMSLSSVEVTVGGHFVLESSYAYNASAGQAINLIITDAANTVKSQAAITSGTASGLHTARIVEKISTPGTYDRKGRIARIGGTGSAGNGVGAGLGYWTRLYFVGR